MQTRNNTGQLNGGNRRYFNLLLVCLALVSVSCSSLYRTPPSGGPPALTVALYPYIPDTNYMQQVVSAAWSQVSGAPPLKFVFWDCYSQDPPPNLDVFVFDAIFLSYFANAQFLRPYYLSEIYQMRDYLPYAINGCIFSNAYYALPQIGCTDMLYYRQGDVQMANVQTLNDLWSVLGPAQYTWPRPPKGVGFMMDFSGGTTAACEYLSTYESYYNTYTTSPPLPSASNLDPKVMYNLSLMVQMAGPGQASWSDQQPYQRATWFDAGAARATVGFTESMSAMPTIQKTVQFKPMPHANNATFSLFYLDVVGVNAKDVGTQKEVWAVQLANLLTSSPVITKAFAGRTRPQYLMPVRKSVFTSLGPQFPQYANMYSIVTNANPQAFRIGPNSRNWLNANKKAIQQQILGLGNATPTQPANEPAGGKGK